MVEIIICAEMKTDNNLWVDKAIKITKTTGNWFEMQRTSHLENGNVSSESYNNKYISI